MFPKILRVHGHSMQPTILAGQKVLLVPYVFIKPKVNDVVAFKVGNSIFLKRIEKMEDGKYFLVGDNKNDSLDSRKLGAVERKRILGKIII